jgi:hypothetical protein
MAAPMSSMWRSIGFEEKYLDRVYPPLPEAALLCDLFKVFLPLMNQPALLPDSSESF